MRGNEELGAIFRIVSALCWKLEENLRALVEVHQRYLKSREMYLIFSDAPIHRLLTRKFIRSQPRITLEIYLPIVEYSLVDIIISSLASM